MLFQCIDCFTQFKFHPNSLVDDYDGQDIEENGTVRAIYPSPQNPHGCMDTVIVFTGDEEEAVSINGKILFVIFMILSMYIMPQVNA